MDDNTTNPTSTTDVPAVPVTDQGGMPQAPVQPEPQVPAGEPVAPVTPPTGEPVVQPMPEPQVPQVPSPESVAPVSEPAPEGRAEQPVQDPNQGGGATGGSTL